MAEENQQLEWRNEISEPADTLKIADKETVVFDFKDEGKKNVHPDFGTSIAFKVLKDNEKEEKVWYVNSRNYDLLGQIKVLGALTGLKVEVTRIGSKKSDTRYLLKKK